MLQHNFQQSTKTILMGKSFFISNLNIILFATQVSLKYLSTYTHKMPSLGDMESCASCNDSPNGKQNWLSGECDGQAGHYRVTQ